MWSELTLRLIESAYEEDLGATGDITSCILPDGGAAVTGRVMARAGGVLCGLTVGPTVCAVFASRLSCPLTFTPAPLHDGDAIGAGATVATVSGPLAAVLAVERTLLNFLGRLCGVATLTRRFVDAARRENPQVQILDTRKTLPGWRELDKYAVRCGGGQNHRFGLHDAVLLKDNHLAGIPVDQLAERLSRMLLPLRGGGLGARQPRFIEVEADTLEQLVEVMKVPGVDIVLLDNFAVPELRRAVELRDAAGLRGRLRLEASGGVRLDSVAAIAATGVDRISVGALSHSAANLDLALDL